MAMMMVSAVGVGALASGGPRAGGRRAVRPGGGMRAAVRCDAEAGPSEKTLNIMRNFSQQYAKASKTYFCSDLSVTAVVIQGLAEHKESLGAPLCPCRHYDDKEAEAANGYWNCPCVPMRERKECHCMLFLTEDNAFCGDAQTMTQEELLELTKDF